MFLISIDIYILYKYYNKNGNKTYILDSKHTSFDFDFIILIILYFQINVLKISFSVQLFSLSI